jgi:hypothetical protein
VPVERRYGRAVYPGQLLNDAPTTVVLMLKNDKQGGLGVPLPAGGTALYAERAGGRLLLGLKTITDRTVGETVRLAAGGSSQVTLTQANAAPREPSSVAPTTGRGREAILTATNGSPFAVSLDIPIGAAGQKIDAEDQDVNRTDGILTWSPQLLSGGHAELRYRY